jgi:hypothetical protein
VSVLKLANDTCHFTGKRTYERIKLSGLTWKSSPGVGSVRTDSIKYAAKCSSCQIYARTTCFDRMPIKVVTVMLWCLGISKWMYLGLLYQMKN